MNCTVEGRERVRAARDRLERHEHVVAVDVLEPSESRTGRWTLDMLLCSSARGVSHDVLDVLGSYQLHARDVSPQGAFWSAVATT